jgi:hypothetical protein
VKIEVQWPGSGALIRKVEAASKAAEAGSRTASWAKNDFRMLLERDNEDKFFRGVDRYGKPFAPLAASTLAKTRNGRPRPNPNPLIPHGFASRVIQCFEVAEQGRALVARWVGIPWIVYHITGADKPGTLWHLPRRDPSGVTPKGWYQIRERFRQYVRDVAAGKG